MGQLPGPGRTICGCIGHVYSVFVEGDSDSSAMPQLGHGPDLDWRTSGHMGQTYFPISSAELNGATDGVSVLGEAVFDIGADIGALRLTTPRLTNGEAAGRGFRYSLGRA